MAKVDVDALFSMTNWMTMIQVGEDSELEVQAIDPRSAAVLIEYYEEKEDTKVGDDKAMKNLWRNCKVKPEVLVERFDDIPTAVRIGITAFLTERLGEDHFFKARGRLIGQAVAKAMTVPSISPPENGSSLKSLSSSESPRKPSEIVPPLTPSA